jgi:uncharacterized protein
MDDMQIHFGMIMAVAMLGLIAGSLGGMLGVGGSVVMIPGLVMFYGQAMPDTPHMNQHIYQAAAMIANVAVSVPAALRHHRAGATNPAVIRWMLPAALVFVLVGVWLSNLFDGRDGAIWLGRVLAVMLVYVIYANFRRLFRPSMTKEDVEKHSRITPGRSGSVGGFMGLNAGLMGVGGGAIAVPMQQLLLKIPLRNCIANSSAVICISAAIGAVYKNLTLYEHGYDWRISVTLALLLAPTCWVGGHLGAQLTHILPSKVVRVAFIGLMIVAAWKMAAI